jgi:hypothetical protein
MTAEMIIDQARWPAKPYLPLMFLERRLKLVLKLVLVVPIEKTL